MKTSSQDVFKVRKSYDVNHPLLLATQAMFDYEDFAAQHDWKTKNPYEQKMKGHLNIQVSKSQRERAMRIFAAIIRIAEHFGYKVVTQVDDTMQLKGYGPQEGTFIVVDDEAIWVRMVEKNNASYTTSSHGWRTQELTPSGLIRLEFDRDYNTEYKLIDTPFSSIEEKLDKVFSFLQQEAAVRKENRIKREIERQKREEEEQRRKEIQRIKEEEKQKISNLLMHSYYSDIADNLRQYASRAEQRENAEEVEWIRMIADCIDPLKEIKHPILSTQEILSLLEVKETPTRYEINTVYKPFFVRR